MGGEEGRRRGGGARVRGEEEGEGEREGRLEASQDQEATQLDSNTRSDGEGGDRCLQECAQQPDKAASHLKAPSRTKWGMVGPRLGCHIGLSQKPPEPLGQEVAHCSS